MSLSRLKWISILAPLLFLAGVDIIRHTIEVELFHEWPGYILVAGVVLFGALRFSETVFGVIERLQGRLAQQNRELLALHQAGLDIAGELGLDEVLQKVVEQARELVTAKYGALSVRADSGEIEAFVTSGITEEERALIGPEPQGHGLLSLVLEEGQRLRTPDLTTDPRSVGFPEHHPIMHSLLAVPIVSGVRVVGTLYTAEKIGALEFSEEDEDTLTRFATQAALAIDNAHLHRRARDYAVVEERERIAREMHDSLAQVLGYVNTKVQAIQELVRTGQTDRADAQLAQLGETARAAYADVREGILGLRTSLGPARGLLPALDEYLERWQEQSGLRAELEVEPAGSNLRGLSPTAELQLLRVIQEGLANVRKHAEATEVTVRLEVDSGEVRAVVADNGKGFTPGQLGSAAFPRFGLSTMRERAETVGGTLDVESEPGCGTRVVVRLPTGGLPLTAGELRASTDR